MHIFGELERLLSETLYPYRIPLTGGALLLLLAGGVWVWRAGWFHRLLSAARRRPAPYALLALAALALLVPLGNYLVAPLWTRSALEEVSPLESGYQAFQPRAVLTGPDPSSPPGPASDIAPTQARVVSRGNWKGADEFHFARGRAVVVELTPGQHVVRVEDFSVRNGPDLYVMLSPAADGYRDGALKLGRLKATDGSFNYEVPAGTDLQAFKSVVIWCEQFAVLFGTAPLTPG